MDLNRHTKTVAKQQKAFAIIDEVLSTSAFITEDLKELAQITYKKKLFQKKNRRPMRKQKIKLIMAKVALRMYFGAVHIEVIKSQPIPKYPSGANSRN